MITEKKYKLSFTSGAALIYESQLIAEQYNHLKDWNLVKTEVLTNNLLQARTEVTSRKIYGELSRRLKNLTDDELSLISNSDVNVKQLIWLAICRHYAFIYDFSIEVLSEHFNKSQFQLFAEDYDAFFNAKSEWNSNLDSITLQTRRKARQVLFKMLKECGIVNDDKELLHQNLSPELRELIHLNKVDEMKIYPGQCA